MKNEYTVNHDNYTITPEEFRRCRKVLGLTQKELGEWLKHRAFSISRIETGRRSASPQAVALLEAYMHGWRPKDSA